MPNIRSRLVGLAPACLMKATYLHPVAVELLTLVAVAGLFILRVLP